MRCLGLMQDGHSAETSQCKLMRNGRNISIYYIYMYIEIIEIMVPAVSAEKVSHL